MLPVVTTIVPVVTFSVARCYLDCRLLLPYSDTRLTAVCCHSDSRRLRCYHSPLAFLSLTHRSLSFHSTFSLAVNDRMYRNTGAKASDLKRKQRNDDGDEQQQRPPLPLHANRARAAASPVSRASPITVLASLSAAASYSLQDLNPPLPPSAPSSPTLSFSRPPSPAPYQLSSSSIPSAQLCLSMLIDPSPSPTPVSTTPPPPPVNAVQPALSLIFVPPALPVPDPVAAPLPVVSVPGNLTLAEVIALCSACCSHDEYKRIRPTGFARQKEWRRFDMALRQRMTKHPDSWDAVLQHVCEHKRVR